MYMLVFIFMVQSSSAYIIVRAFWYIYHIHIFLYSLEWLTMISPTMTTKEWEKLDEQRLYEDKQKATVYHTVS